MRVPRANPNQQAFLFPGPLVDAVVRLVQLQPAGADDLPAPDCAGDAGLPRTVTFSCYRCTARIVCAKHSPIAEVMDLYFAWRKNHFCQPSPGVD